jgi:plastocyanin
VPVMKLARCAAAIGLSLTLAACSGSGARSASEAAPAGSGGAAKPTVVPIPSAPLVGQKAPGPYAPNGAINVSNGQATIDATDTLKWQPDTIVAKAGEKVTLNIRNNGNTAHTIFSPALNIPQTDNPIQKTSMVSFTAPSQPGAYQYWCNVPGHAEAGMVGQVIIQ